jgi:hypothetical protein
LEQSSCSSSYSRLHSSLSVIFSRMKSVHCIVIDRDMLMTLSQREGEVSVGMDIIRVYVIECSYHFIPISTR